MPFRNKLSAVLLASALLGPSVTLLAQQTNDPNAPSQNASQLNTEAASAKAQGKNADKQKKAAKKAEKADKKAAKGESKVENDQKKAAAANQNMSSPQ